MTDTQQIAPDPGVQTQLLSLSVQNFRNYDACRIEIDAPKVLLLGENGAGKTNLMEAVSLLAPGRGLRRAKAEHLPRVGAPALDWAVSARLVGAGEPVTIGTGVQSEMICGRDGGREGGGGSCAAMAKPSRRPKSGGCSRYPG